MKVVPMELADANAFVAQHHRHHKPVVGHRFSIGAAKDGVLVGVAIVGRPVARMVNKDTTLEVTRRQDAPVGEQPVGVGGRV